MTVPTLAEVANPVAMGYGVRLGQNLFQLAYADGVGLRVQAAPPEQSQRIIENPEDVAQEFGLVWSRADFGGGEGLWRAHRTDGSRLDASRYWTSENLDVSPPRVSVDARVPSELQLSRDFEQVIGTDGDTYAGPMIVTSDDRIFAVDTSPVNDEIVELTSLDATNPVATVVHTAAGTTFGTIGSIASGDPNRFLASEGRNDSGLLSGAVLYNLNGGVSGSWSTHRSANNTSFGVFFAGGRMLYSEVTSSQSVLKEILTPGTPADDVIIDTGPGNQGVSAVIDAGTAILAAWADGTIRAYQSVDGKLTVVAESDLPLRDERESVSSMVAIGDLMLIGTGVVVDALNSGAIGRLWLASLSGVIPTDYQLLKVWGEPHETTTTDFVPASMVKARNSIWIAGRHGMPITSAPQRALWRYDLTTGGLSHWSYVVNDPNSTADSMRVGSSGGRLWVSIDAFGLYREISDYVAQGEIHLPLVDHFSGDDKTWVGFKAEIEMAGVGSEVTIFWTTDPGALGSPASSQWILGKTFTVSDTGQTLYQILDPVSGVNPQSRYLALRVLVKAQTDRADTPRVRWVSTVSYPTQNDVIVEVPILISDVVRRPNRRPLRVLGHGNDVWTSLKTLEGSSVELEVYRPSEKVRGLVMSVTAPQRAQTNRGSQLEFAVVTVRGRRYT